MYACLCNLFGKFSFYFKLKMKLDLKEICDETGWTYRSFPEVETVSVSSSSATIEANLWIDHYNGFLEYSIIDRCGEVLRGRVSVPGEFGRSRVAGMLLFGVFPSYLEGLTNIKERLTIFKKNKIKI